MGVINVLDISVANLIAAGEVVERPASAIKEMVENAIDAGATQITVEIAGGGIAFMRVSDNGCGMSGEDAVLAVRRHATSKIKTAEDLASIFTLGFRGEALAAITAVSSFRIMTKRASDAEGTLLAGEYGKVEEVSPVGCPDGTTVICEKLFATTPARLKFLKSNTSEGAAVAQTVEKLAVSRPEIAFRFLSDGNLKFATTGDGNLQNAIYSVYGSAFSAKLIAVGGGAGGIAVTGFVSSPDNARGNRTMQQFFINSRCVRSKTLTASLEAAFRSHIPSDKFPSCVLDVKIPPSLVDVNIHPAKLEVKFSNEKAVFDALYAAVRIALEKNTPRPTLSFGETEKVTAHPKIIPYSNVPEELFAAAEARGRASSLGAPEPEKTADAVKTSEPPLIRTLPLPPYEKKVLPPYDDDIPVDVPPLRDTRADQIYGGGFSRSGSHVGERLGAETNFDGFAASSRLYGSTVRETPLPQAEEPVSVGDTDAAIAGAEAHPIPEYRIVGEVFSSYIVLEVGDKMILVDKHAAHERINFERLRASMTSTRNVQLILTPIEFPVTEEEAAVCRDYREELEAVGYEFDVTEREVTLRGIPQDFTTAEARDLFAALITATLETGASVATTRQAAFERALYQGSCKASVKAGRVYDMAHIRWICDNLLRYDCIKFCPHGRPVAFELSKKELDARFGRT